MTTIEMIDTEKFNQGTQIKVIGVGGGGGNAVEHMIANSVQGVEFVCANTDAQALIRSNANRTIQLGLSGLGAGSKPDKGREAAEAAVEDIRAAIDGSHMLFITAGMGGGTGTGAAPVIAKVAKEILAAKDITLDIQVYNDYVVPNTVVDDGTVDANYFQHLPYLEDFNAENNTHIVSVSAIHVEPMGLYGGKQTTLDAISGK